MRTELGGLRHSQTLHDLKTPCAVRGSPNIGGGSYLQSMCPPSDLPCSTVKFGTARHNYINHHSGGGVTGVFVRVMTSLHRC